MFIKKNILSAAAHFSVGYLRRTRLIVYAVCLVSYASAAKARSSLLFFPFSLSDSYSLIHYSRVVRIPRLSLCFTSYDFLIFWCTCKANKCLTFPKFPDLSIEYHLLSAMLPPSIGWFLTHRVTQIYRMYMVSRASAAMTHILLIFYQPPFLS